MADPVDPWASPSAETGPYADNAGDDDVAFVDADSGARFMAYFIDSLLLMAILIAVIAVMAFSVAMVSPDDGLAFIESPGFDLFSRVFGFASQIGYGAVFEGSGWHATPGKKLMGLEVVDYSNRPTDFAEALKRNVVKSLMLMCCGLLAFTAIGQQGIWNDQSGHRTVKRVRL